MNILESSRFHPSKGQIVSSTIDGQQQRARPELAGSVGISHLVAHIVQSMNERTQCIQCDFACEPLNGYMCGIESIFHRPKTMNINQAVEFLAASRKSHENNKSYLNRVHLGQRQVQCEHICYWRECRTKEIEIGKSHPPTWTCKSTKLNFDTSDTS